MNRDAFLLPDRAAALLHGAHLAVVASIDDPDRLNRVQVRLVAFDAQDGQDAPLWARVVSPFAGSDRGAFLMPDVDDEVLVVFAGGDSRFPLVVGGLWNGSAASPADLGADGNRYKRIRSKNGITVTLDDRRGQETLTLETPGGQRLTLKDGPNSVTLEDANGNSIVASIDDPDRLNRCRCLDRLRRAGRPGCAAVGARRRALRRQRPRRLPHARR